MLGIPHLYCGFSWKFRSIDAKINTMYVKRLTPIEAELRKKSVLLIGPRRTGKSAFIRNQLRVDRVYDLLKADVFQALSARPSLIRESLQPKDKLIVIDEVQRLPNVLDEIHSMIEERKIRFLLTGSSARKLRRTHTSLMAGRVRVMHLHPFCFPELCELMGGNVDLGKIVATGCLPPVAIARTEPNGDSEAWRELKDYGGDYLHHEILAEAVVRKIEAFSRFLPVAARMNGELINFEAIASDSQVPARTIREYYSILQDTLLGRTLEPLRLKGKNSRKATATAKFYFFDCGITNALLGRRSVAVDSTEFGILFETWIHNEIRAYIDYVVHGDAELQFWRHPNGDEVDLVVNGEIAIEVKATRNVNERHIGGLLALSRLKKMRKLFVVSRDPNRRQLSGVELLSWQDFAESLWRGEIF